MRKLELREVEWLYQATQDLVYSIPSLVFKPMAIWLQYLVTPGKQFSVLFKASPLAMLLQKYYLPAKDYLESSNFISVLFPFH